MSFQPYVKNDSLSLETSLILYHIAIGHVGTSKTDSVNIVPDYLVPGTAVRCPTPVPIVLAALSQYILKRNEIFYRIRIIHRMKIQWSLQ